MFVCGSIYIEGKKKESERERWGGGKRDCAKYIVPGVSTLYGKERGEEGEKQERGIVRVRSINFR